MTTMTKSSRASLVLFIIYSLFILYSTTIPYDFSTDTRALRHNFETIRWSPLVRPDGSRESIPDVVSNILLFIPFGLLIGLVVLPRQKAKSRRNTILLAIIGSVILSGLVETIQIVSISRVTSVTDLLTNTIGGLSGALLALLLSTKLTAPLSQWSRRQKLHSPVVLLLIFYLAALFLSFTIPFDISLDIDHVKDGLKSARLDPITDPTPYSKMIGNALWLAGLSFLLCYVIHSHALFGRSRTRKMVITVSTAVAASVCLTIILEGLQIFINSRLATTREIL
jgi:glycopeptide antibiotics resistance protein